jgi:antitoxin CcdA
MGAPVSRSPARASFLLSGSLRAEALLSRSRFAVSGFDACLGYTEPMEAHKIASGGHVLYDRKATKKPTRLSVNSDLLEKARELGVDLSTTLEEALAQEVHKRQRETWLEENREAIEAYNEHVAQHGVFSAGLRGF